MGITIHYGGRLKDPTSVSLLVQELQLACQKLDWPCQAIDERILGTAEYDIYHEEDEHTLYVTTETKPVDDRQRGIVIQPPECETLYLTFNRHGEMMAYDTPFGHADVPGYYHVREYLFCKTQFGTAETHMAICDLLRLVEPYMAEFEVSDEGRYWQSGDPEELKLAMGYLEQLINKLSNADNVEDLERLLGIEIQGKDAVEIGKQLKQIIPPWRLRGEHGVSAHEN
jgi:hypothetical protein